MQTPQLVDHFFRTEYGKAVSHLTNKFGSKNLELAEDSVQDALIKAMQTWPYAEIPQNPTGWILRVASNKMIDQLRRAQKSDNQEVPEKSEEVNDEISLDTMNDDMVRMMFACCHPSLSSEYQIILTLKILGGLSVREIASALVKKEETIAKGYTRAKKKFKVEEINLQLPPANEIESRLNMVLKIIYLLFNERYKAAEGPELIREDLCEEAIRLNKVLLDNEICNTPAANGLMSMMLFQVARFPARVNAKGQIISLEDQDRSLWNRELINLGLEYLERASDTEEMSEYVIQAAISAVHCQSRSFEETNWNNILNMYDLHLKLNNNPIIELNRIIPLQKVHGSLLAFKEMERLEATGFFEEYYLFYAIKAKILEDIGDTDTCRKTYEQALKFAKNEKEKTYLADKISRLG